MNEQQGTKRPNHSAGRMLNRLLIVLSLAALLGGLLVGQDRVVLLNATLLCLSCLGLG